MRHVVLCLFLLFPLTGYAAPSDPTLRRRGRDLQLERSALRNTANRRTSIVRVYRSVLRRAR